MIDVSIIIPVYNVENFIVRCLNSIVKQKNVVIEILLIDDCSTDNSVKVIKEYVSNLKSNIDINILVNESNKGVSYTRNKGINAAKGKCVYFLDGDDELNDETSISVLYNDIIISQSQISIGEISILKNNKEYYIPYYTNKLNQPYIHNNIISHYLKGEWAGVVWNKIIDRKFIIDNELFFYEGLNLGEDELWSFKAYLNTSKISFVKQVTYIHYIGENTSSLTNLVVYNYEISKIIMFEILNILKNKSISYNEKPFSEYLKKYIITSVNKKDVNFSNWISNYKDIRNELIKNKINLIFHPILAYIIYQLNLTYLIRRNIRFNSVS